MNQAPKPENIQEAINKLNSAKDEVLDLLHEVPNLQIRVRNTMETLSNGLAHTLGANSLMGLTASTQTEFPPLTNVLGIEIPDAYESFPATVHVGEEDIADLRRRAYEAYDSFLDRDNTQLRESLTDLELRAVAKIAGLDVTEDRPKHIDAPFLEEIRRSIIANKQKQMAIADELAKTPQPVMTAAPESNLPAEEIETPEHQAKREHVKAMDDANIAATEKASEAIHSLEDATIDTVATQKAAEAALADATQPALEAPKAVEVAPAAPIETPTKAKGTKK